MYRPVIIPHRNHFFGPREPWIVRLGDVVREVSSDRLAAALRIYIAELPPDAASAYATRIDVCLRIRDEAIGGAAQTKDWAGMTAGVAAEEDAKRCLSAIRSEIMVALVPKPPSDTVVQTNVPTETTAPITTPPAVPLAVPLAVAGGAVLAVLLLS